MWRLTGLKEDLLTDTTDIFAVFRNTPSPALQQVEVGTGNLHLVAVTRVSCTLQGRTCIMLCDRVWC